MINVQTFQSNLPNRFLNPSLVARDVLRCEEADDHGTLFALHYFSIADDLAKTANELADFQDEVLGSSYYETQGDLRWNHYLYFIADEAVLSSAEGKTEKKRIESDRSYARKYVLTNEQFHQAIAQRNLSVTASDSNAAGDVLSRWTKRLMDSKLDVVVDLKGPTETVRSIAEGAQTKRTKSAPVRKSTGADSLTSGFISKLEIKRFRSLFMDRTFDNLGSFNLIVGSNGTGKTSVLEAIEYLFCSDNARISPTKAVNINGWVINNGKPVEVNSDKSIEILKSRNLTWYGIKDLRGSTLANSFARYNFLSTDEAALLAKDPRIEIDDILSKVVAGPKAADLWSHLKKLPDLINAEVSKVQTRLQKWVAEKKTSEEQIKNAAASPDQAQLAFLALCEDMFRLGWKSKFDKDLIPVSALPSLQRIFSLIREILSADWIKGAATPMSIRSQADVFCTTVLTLQELSKKISETKRSIFDCETGIRSKSNMLILVENLGKMLASGVSALTQKIHEDELKLAIARNLIATVSSLEDDALAPTNSISGVTSINSHLEALLKKEKTLLEELQIAGMRLKELRVKKSNASVLLEDIRRLASQFVEHNHDLKNCPVCRTQFDAVELRRRVEESVESTADAALDLLVEQVEKIASEQANCNANRLRTEMLCRYAKARGLNTELFDLPRILNDVVEMRGQVSALEDSLLINREKLRALENAGFSAQWASDLTDQANATGINLPTDGNYSETKGGIERDLNAEKGRLIEASHLLEEIKQKFISIYETIADATLDLTEERMLSIAEQKSAALVNAVHSLDLIAEFMNVDEKSSLANLSVLIGSTVEACESYLAAAANELRLGGIVQSAKENIIEFDANILADTNQLEHLRSAVAVINDICINDSLPSATESELEAARKVTAAIFSNIHTPWEYGVSRGLQQPLFRLDTKESVTLKEISTGQRSAFVLSLFLAMNAKLQSAPKVLLFDDPIAHIDDLNSLSFLDHLRHLVLTGRLTLPLLSVLHSIPIMQPFFAVPHASVLQIALG